MRHLWGTWPLLAKGADKDSKDNVRIRPKQLAPKRTSPLALCRKMVHAKGSGGEQIAHIGRRLIRDVTGLR